MGKIDINKKQKQDALLNTAFDLFIRQGINKTTIAEIVEQAGVAKGTFYLYFKDKYDIRNKLIAKKASQIFRIADDALHQTDITPLEDRIIFLIDNIIDQLNADKTLLNFISKNLSWGIFKNELLYSTASDIDFYNIYSSVFEQSEPKYKNPEVLIFMIVELVNATCFSCILYEDPIPVNDLKPYLFDSVRQIMKSQEL
jgi:Transcriptional regulator